MASDFDHEKRADDLRRLLHELDLGMIESVDQLDDEVLAHLVRELGSREEIERLWDLMKGGEIEAD